MEVLEDGLNSSTPIVLDNDMKGFLKEISKWAKFLSIVGFIGIGFMVIAALFIMMMGAKLSSFSNQSSPFPTTVMGLVYLVFALLYFFPINYLMRFSNEMRKGLNSNDKALVSNGLESLKSHYKFIGILMIVILSLYVLMFLAGMVIAAAVR